MESTKSPQFLFFFIILCVSFVHFVNAKVDISVKTDVTTTTSDPTQRALALLANMSLADKFAMVRGWDGNYAGTIINNTALGIPALHLQDGPQVDSSPLRDPLNMNAHI
jgi:hypothetical protein